MTGQRHCPWQGEDIGTACDGDDAIDRAQPCWEGAVGFCGAEYEFCKTLDRVWGQGGEAVSERPFYVI